MINFLYFIDDEKSRDEKKGVELMYMIEKQRNKK